MTAAQTLGMMESGYIPIELGLFFDEIYRYIVFSENGKVFVGCDEEQIRLMIAHRFHKRRLLVHRGDDRKIDGIGMWSRFPKGESEDYAAHWKDDDEKGGEIFIAAMFADNPTARRDLVFSFIAAEPDCLHLDLVTFRHRRPGRRPEKVSYDRKILSRMLK